MHDVLTNVSEKTIKCLDKGHVTILDVMPRLVPDDRKTADYAIVQAARVSYGDGTKTINEDRGLIRYLLRQKHTTPFEMIEIKFNVKMPIFIARQMVRHRTANINEYSGRYSMMKDEFYKPEIENVRQQSSVNKQGSGESINEVDASNFIEKIDFICNQSYEEYEKAIQNGVAREQARMLLPVNLYTEWYWKVDLHNLLHFLALRCDAHAQWEIRVFANAMLELINPIVPWAVEAWEDYHEHRGAIRLTKLEVDAMVSSLGGISVNSLKTDNKREQEEWKTKAAMLGLSVKNIEK
jgi:thymidylate synthase (FAD)